MFLLRIITRYSRFYFVQHVNLDTDSNTMFMGLDIFNTLFVCILMLYKNIYFCNEIFRQRLCFAEKSNCFNNTTFRFVEAVVDYYEYLTDLLSIRALTDDIITSRCLDFGIRLLVTIRTLLWDYSHSSPAFTERIVKSGMFRKLMADIHFISTDGLKKLEEHIEVI